MTTTCTHPDATRLDVANLEGLGRSVYRCHRCGAAFTLNDDELADLELYRHVTVPAAPRTVEDVALTLWGAAWDLGVMALRLAAAGVEVQRITAAAPADYPPPKVLVVPPGNRERQLVARISGALDTDPRRVAAGWEWPTAVWAGVDVVMFR